MCTCVFPVLIPTLITSPMTVFNASALASLVTVAGNALSRCPTVILNALVKVLEEDKDDEFRAALDEARKSGETPLCKTQSPSGGSSIIGHPVKVFLTMSRLIPNACGHWFPPRVRLW